MRISGVAFGEPMNNAAFQVSAWHDGNNAYGLRVGRFRDQFFDRSWNVIILSLAEGGAPFEAELTPGFWRKCCEIRHPKIRDWFRKNGITTWPKGKPPTFLMCHMGESRFRVELISKAD